MQPAKGATPYRGLAQLLLAVVSACPEHVPLSQSLGVARVAAAALPTPARLCAALLPTGGPTEHQHAASVAEQRIPETLVPHRPLTCALRAACAPLPRRWRSRASTSCGCRTPTLPAFRGRCRSCTTWRGTQTLWSSRCVDIVAFVQYTARWAQGCNCHTVLTLTDPN